MKKILIIVLAMVGLSLTACSESPPESRYVDEGADAQATPAASTPAVAEEPAHAHEGSVAPGDVIVAGVSLTPHESWSAVDTRSPMRQAQFAVGSGADAAEVVVFHFGSGQGGTVEDNLLRWARMVLNEQGEPTMPTISEFDVNGLEITLAEFTGTYLSGMPGGEQTPRASWTLLAAVIENGPSGTIFPRLVGPSQTVLAHREAFVQFLQSAKVSQ